MTNTKMIRAFVAAAAAGGLALTASPASAAVASYITDFEGITINDTSGWRMSNPAYDAEITGGALRISNAVTSGSFGDQLFSPELEIPATEGGVATVFDATFTLLRVPYQEGLRVTVSPDNGSGGRAGFLSIEHVNGGLKIVSSGSNGNASNWKDIVIAKGLDVSTSHIVKVRVEKVGDGVDAANNDVFSVKVDNGSWVKNKTFEAYYRATGEVNYETDTLLFRVSGTAVPSLLHAGLLIDDLSMSTS